MMTQSGNRWTVLFGILSFFFLTYPVYGQPGTFDWKAYYGKPLHIEPLALSGSMGEFRATHFHTGYDFRVGALQGLCICCGRWLCFHHFRIAIRLWKCLYVTHPNGTVSLYGHLHEFSPHIAA